MSNTGIKLLLISGTDLMARAAGDHNLTVDKTKAHLFWQTSSVDKYSLDSEFMTNLQKIDPSFVLARGMEPDFSDKFVYLHCNSQLSAYTNMGHSYWAFSCEEQSLYLSVSFYLEIDERQRGVVFHPLILGNCLPASNNEVVNRLAIALGRLEGSHVLLREMSDHKSNPVVSWTKMGLGGLRSLRTLFSERFGGSYTTRVLSASNVSPFDPAPNEDQFIEEDCQPVLIKVWEDQLREFKEKLV